MDIALELLDTYVFDAAYATLLPAKPAPYSLSSNTFGNNTTSIADLKAASPWHFEPASELISFTPGDMAYMSQWNRDNIYRQALSLFLITWYLLHPSILLGLHGSGPRRASGTFILLSSVIVWMVGDH